MPTERERLRRLTGLGSGAPTTAIAAATVVLVRDRPDGIETLMLRRSTRVSFAGGAWVFPGGRVDPGDAEPTASGSAAEHELGAARRAAVREAGEEAGLALDPESLVTLWFWLPPPEAAKRYATWFFLASAPDGPVTVDGSEIHDHMWVRPADALARRDAGEIELAPPTWMTLRRLAACRAVDAALADARAQEPERFVTHVATAGDTIVALWHGDAGYEDRDAGRPGARHRLWMADDGWRFERT